MTDREKVIKALGCLCDEDEMPDICPCEFLYGYSCVCNIAKEAIALLKEQEPMSPVYEQLLTQEIPRCGKCGYRLVKGNDKYCCRCGQAVKWNEYKRSD